MCDPAEAIYWPNDIVWVKLGPVWWPGRVCGEDEIPPEIMKDLRKTPIAIVKFFQEDSFEYVKSLANIYHYHCPRKNEFIKKGLDMLRSTNRGAPSNMKLFPEDVVRAESLTQGNPAILQSDVFLPEEKPAYTDIFASKKKTPKKVKLDVKKKSTSENQSTPRLITHPRFLKLSSGQSTDYEVRERQQTPIRAECDQDDAAPPTSYSCTECGYKTSRLNVMVWHNKSHTRNYASTPTSVKGTKRKSAASAVKLKERSSSCGSPSIQLTTDEEEVSAAKIPKTNGQLKATRGRKKGTSTTKKTPVHEPHTKETNLASSTQRISPQKVRRGSTHKSDEIHKSLLEDWLEDDVELDDPLADELSPARSAAGENTALANGSTNSQNSDGKSCFDFDDSEDHLVIDESKFKPGRKIPRLIDKSSSSTLAADDVIAMQDGMGNMDVEATPADSTAKYQSGVEDNMDVELSLVHSTTSQLQEMGVDNEIEIKTEDTYVDEVVIKSVPPKKSRRNLKTEKKANDDAKLLHDQVNQLLTEIAEAPAKLPDIPRSHKKMQLKAYQKQAEAEMAAIEAEAAHNEPDEVETTQKVASEAEDTQKAATEAEAEQKTAVNAESVQEEVVEAVTSQAAAMEVEAAEKIPTNAKAGQMATEQKTIVEMEGTEKMLTPQYKVKEQKAYDIHPDLMNVEVSSNSLPSPSKCLVTSDLVESSISIGASVTVENETSDDPWFTTLPAKVSSETLGAENIATEASGAPNQEAAAITSSSHSPLTPTSVANVAGGSEVLAADISKIPVKCSATSKTTKPPNTTPAQQSGQQAVKYITPSEYKALISKLNASIGPISPSKTSDEPLKAIKTTIKMTGGKKVLLANSQATNSSPKFLILANYKQGSPLATTTTATNSAATTTISTPVGRSINLANATAVRVSPNILQKAAAQRAAAAALAKSSGKSIVLDASTFQSLFQTQPQQLRKMQAQVAAATSKSQIPSGINVVAASNQPGIVFVADGCSMSATNSYSDSSKTISSSSNAGQTIDYNYIVDDSGNLVQEDEPSPTRTPTKDKDILAKALENTDGLQTEMALSEEVTNSELDGGSVVKATDTCLATEAIHENITLNTTPIMSTYETPSRVVATANVAEMVGSSAVEGESEFVT